MTQENTSSFIKHNTLFGLLIGLSFIAACFVFIWSGYGIAINPQIGNIFFSLSIFGSYIAIKRYRDDFCNGEISYWRAFFTGLYILGVAAFLYAVFLGLYLSFNPDAWESYLKTITLNIQERNIDYAQFYTTEESFLSMINPVMIAVIEFLNRLLTSLFFLLLIAALVKRTPIKI